MSQTCLNSPRFVLPTHEEITSTVKEAIKKFSTFS
jgi:hypothetical protein